MPYRSNNYSFVIDSSFQPLTMQEMLVPFTAYKEAFEQTEAAYDDLSDKADKFSYLSKTLPEGSQGREIYEGYANDLRAQAEDLAKNGLSMGNRRALTNLKRRYQGEIGRLVDADAAMKEEKKLRREMSSKDSSMLYGEDNLNIDQFLDGNTPNLYNISGTELYTRGAAAGKAASSRVYSAGDEGSTLNGYYRKWVERNGYSKESMDAFRANVAAIPELQQAALDILKERGADVNLKGDNYNRAYQSVINGIIDGAVYQEKVTPHRDEGVMSAAEKAQDARAQQSYELGAMKLGYKRENGKWVKDTTAATAVDTGFVTNSGNPVYLDEKKRPYALGSDGKTKYYDNDKDGNYTDKNPYVKPLKEKPTDADDALFALNKTPEVFRNNKGFIAQVGNENRHYEYIGGISNHRGTWGRGKIGEDVPGAGWGFTSASNIMSPWGNFSAESIDKGEKNKIHLLARNELQNSFYQVVKVGNKIEIQPNVLGKHMKDLVYQYAEENKIPDPDNLDIQVIEVPNEHGGSRKGYLIAVRTQ